MGVVVVVNVEAEVLEGDSVLLADVELRAEDDGEGDVKELSLLLLTVVLEFPLLPPPLLEPLPRSP